MRYQPSSRPGGCRGIGTVLGWMGSSCLSPAAVRGYAGGPVQVQPVLVLRVGTLGPWGRESPVTGGVIPCTVLYQGEGRRLPGSRGRARRGAWTGWDLMPWKNSKGGRREEDGRVVCLSLCGWALLLSKQGVARPSKLRYRGHNVIDQPGRPACRPSSITCSVRCALRSTQKIRPDRGRSLAAVTGEACALGRNDRPSVATRAMSPNVIRRSPEISEGAASVSASHRPLST